MTHTLEYVNRNPVGLGYWGSCSCSDVDWVDEGWSGQVMFVGDSKREVENHFHDHLVEEGLV